MSESPKAQAIIDQMKKGMVQFVVSLPDRVTARLSDQIRNDPEFTFIPVCKEDEGVSICSALSYGNKRAILLIQHTGMLDSVNSLRAMASEMRVPLVMIVGLLQKEPGVKPTASARFGVKITEPLLDLLEIRHALVDASGDEAQIAGLIHEAYANSIPTAILIGREVA